MDTGVLIGIGVVVLLLILLGLYLWASYNSLVTLKQRVDEAWNAIAAQLQRRAELIPPLVENVRGYAAHERGVLDAVTKARSETVAASTPAEATSAESHMQQALRSIFSSAESYPQLVASPAFLQQQSDLVDTEEKIQASRRFYNGGVREFNAKIQVFPNSLFAKRLGFSRREFFEAGDGASIAEPPRIQF